LIAPIGNHLPESNAQKQSGKNADGKYEYGERIAVCLYEGEAAGGKRAKASARENRSAIGKRNVEIG